VHKALKIRAAKNERSIIDELEDILKRELDSILNPKAEKWV